MALAIAVAVRTQIVPSLLLSPSTQPTKVRWAPALVGGQQQHAPASIARPIGGGFTAAKHSRRPRHRNVTDDVAVLLAGINPTSLRSASNYAAHVKLFRP